MGNSGKLMTYRKLLFTLFLHVMSSPQSRKSRKQVRLELSSLVSWASLNTSLREGQAALQRPRNYWRQGQHLFLVKCVGFLAPGGQAEAEGMR